MHTILLTIHIVALSLSIVATVIMTILALLSRSSPFIARMMNLGITIVGIGIGIVLLIQNPLGSRCLELTTYLVAFSFAYRFINARSVQLSLAKTSTSLTH